MGYDGRAERAPRLSNTGRGQGLRGLRSRRALWAILALVALSASAAEPKAKRLKLSFPGIVAGAGVASAEARTVSETLQSEVAATGLYDVVGATELSTVLGLERQRQ